jgi:hypothetical protein
MTYRLPNSRKSNFATEPVEASFQRTIGYPSLAFEEVNDLGENLIEGHR